MSEFDEQLRELSHEIKQLSGRNEDVSENGEDDDEGEERPVWPPIFDSSDDDEEDSDEESFNNDASWQTARGTYSVEIKVGYVPPGSHKVTAKLIFDKKSIGKFQGSILDRPSRYFYEMGDASGELEWLTKLFCDSNGGATRISTNLEGRDVYNGGFFHIDRVAVDKEHKGQDVGLHMVHEILCFLRGTWNLAVLSPGILPGSLEGRSGITKEDLQEKEDDTSEQKQRREEMIDAVELKIAKHFARIGFQQAGRNPDECNAWYMTALTYFGRDFSIPSSMALRRWKTKEEMQNLDIYIRPKIHAPIGVDKELQDLVKQTVHSDLSLHSEEFQNVLSDIKDLVRHKNASIHGSRALFIVVSDPAATGKELLPTLLGTFIELSPDAVNAADEFDNRPLHMAASATNVFAIKYLLEAGAEQTSNCKGCTPLKCLEDKRQDWVDFLKTMDIRTARPMDAIPFLESVLLFMTDDVRGVLIEGWLPPRMMHMFAITAEVTKDELQQFNLQHYQYIPTDVFQRNARGLSSFFYDGWRTVWEVIMNLIHRRKIPTASQVEMEISRIQGDHLRNWNIFLEEGGKVEYALDALLRVTEDVYVHNGPDAWDYETFQEDIEKHPKTPLDCAFDLARVKFLGLTNDNFNLQPKGPYR